MQVATKSPKLINYVTIVYTNYYFGFARYEGSRDGSVVRTLTSHQCGFNGFDSLTWRHIWVEFVVGSRQCSERFFSGYSDFPLSLKLSISKISVQSRQVYEEPPRGRAICLFTTAKTSELWKCYRTLGLAFIANFGCDKCHALFHPMIYYY